MGTEVFDGSGGEVSFMEGFKVCLDCVSSRGAYSFTLLRAGWID